MDDHELLERIYAGLDGTAAKLSKALTEAAFPAAYHFYNGHYRKTGNGYEIEHFPIPVIEVTGICDIEIGLKEITVSARLSKERAVSLDYRILPFPFEAYSIQEYLTDLYPDGMDFEEFRNELLCIDEDEIGFSFLVEDVSAENIVATVRLLATEGFCY